MVNLKQYQLLTKDVYRWNEWRKANPAMLPQLGAANLIGANLIWADLRNAYLGGATLYEADLTNADLRGADLSDTHMRGANLHGANLHGANLTRANLTYAALVKTDLSNATLTECNIFGVSAWAVKLDGAIQKNLQIADIEYNEPTITVDNLEVAQFIYLLLHNQKIRDVIDTITSKAVLILGRFTPKRKAVLEALREELRRLNYLPILFDFDRPSSRNLTETISTLAHISRFVIADITDAKSIPQELQRIVPALPSLPVQPLILASQYEYSMFRDFLDYPWVLTPYRYNNPAELLTSVEEKVIGPAAAKAKEIEKRREEFAKMS